MTKKIAVVLGSFHKQEAEEMLEEAYEAAKSRSLSIAEVIWVPGAMEKPLALKRVLERDEVDGALALGIIEKGETQHGLVMGASVTSAILQLQMDLMKPIGVGILGPGITPEQIPSRVRPYAKAAVEALATMLV